MPVILLIEDERVLARNIEISLTRAGYGVLNAASVRGAQALLREASIDLVIADINLDDGDGIDFINKNKTSLGNVPLVVMTGQDSVVNRARTDDFPVSVFVAKPFALSRLREVVAALLEESNPQATSHANSNKSVVMYSHDTIGLGHMRRNVAIARELVKRVPDLSVLLIVGCPKGILFETEPGIDYVKLPSLSKLSRDRYQAGSLRLDSQTTRAVRMGIIERVVTTLRPSVLLVDHEPAGVWNELEPTLKRLRGDGSTRVILGLRDILDDPDLLRTRWAQSGKDTLIRDYYDYVMIYGNQTFYPSAELYGLDDLKQGAIEYCGVVTSAMATQRQHSSCHTKRIVVAGGGGRDAYPLIDTALSAYELITLDERPDLMLVAGPLMEQDLRIELQIRARRLGVPCLEMVTDFPALLEQTDLLITMAGYNSVNEALAARCPLVVVPRVGPSSEQRIRAAKLEEIQLGRVIYREELTPESIADAMCSANPVRTESNFSPLQFSGAGNAAEIITAQFVSTERLDGQESARVFSR